MERPLRGWATNACCVEASRSFYIIQSVLVNDSIGAMNIHNWLSLAGFLPTTSVRLLAIQFFESDGSKNLEADPQLARINCHFRKSPVTAMADYAGSNTLVEWLLAGSVICDASVKCRPVCDGRERQLTGSQFCAQWEPTPETIGGISSSGHSLHLLPISV